MWRVCQHNAGRNDTIDTIDGGEGEEKRLPEDVVPSQFG